IFSSYVDSFFKTEIGLASVRAGNVIGGGDWAKNRIVPDLVRAIDGRLPLTIRNAHSVRPWQHVLEPLSGYLLLAAQLSENPKEFAGVWNFGPNPDNFRTVTDLVQTLQRGNECFASLKVAHAEGESPLKETKMLRLNCDRAISKLSWHPR